MILNRFSANTKGHDPEQSNARYEHPFHYYTYPAYLADAELLCQCQILSVLLGNLSEDVRCGFQTTGRRLVGRLVGEHCLILLDLFSLRARAREREREGG